MREEIYGDKRDSRDYKSDFYHFYLLHPCKLSFAKSDFALNIYEKPLKIIAVTLRMRRTIRRD